MKTCVMVGIPTKGEIKTKTVDNLLGMLRYSGLKGIEAKHIFAEGTVVQLVRTKIVEEFLKYPQFSHLLWIDSDQTFSPDFLDKLLSYDKDIVAAISKVRSGENYNVYEYDKETKLYRPLKLEKEEGLIKVDAVGMGMMLVKRKVFECIRRIEADKAKSEDIVFCERAKELNFEIWADTSLKLGHIVTVEIK